MRNKNLLKIIIAVLICALAIALTACDLDGIKIILSPDSEKENAEKEKADVQDKQGEENETGGNNPSDVEDVANKQEEVSYRVVFLDYDSSFLYEASGIKRGEPAIYQGQSPERRSDDNNTYSFVGWDKDISSVSDNMTVYAKYKAFAKNNSASGDNTVTASDSRISNYGKDMSLNAYIGQQNQEMKLYNLGVFDDFYVFYFDLGLIKRTPVYTSFAVEYGEQDLELKLTFNKLSEEGLENSVSRAIQTVDTHSYTGGFNIGFEREIKVKAKVMGIGLEGKFTASESTDHHWTNNWGTVTTESSSTVNSYVQTYGEGYEINLNVSEQAGFKKGYSYRVSFYETIKSFGILYYDLETKQYTVAYETMLMANQTRLVIEESSDESGDFNYNVSKTMEFDVDRAIEIANNNMPTPDTRIHIKTAQDFSAYMHSSTAGKKYVLDNDLDFSGFPWTPAPEFQGTLDGQNYKIKNLSYTMDNGNNDSLFGIFTIVSGTIRNVVITDLNISVRKFHDSLENVYAGGICGILKSGSIESVEITSNGNIYMYHDSDDLTRKTRAFVGGFVGELQGGTISGCAISNSTIYGKTRINYNTNSTADCWCYVGGIVGHLTGGTVSGCLRYNNVNVTSYTLSGSMTSAYHCHVGGIAGYKDAGAINNCQSSEEGLVPTTEIIGNRQANSSSKGKASMIGN